MTSIKLLDPDLANELRHQVKRDGLLWESLPIAIKMRYLNPLIQQQVTREQSSMGGVCGAA